MSRTAETCRAQRYSDDVGCSSLMPADREPAAVHEPGDDDGARHQSEDVAQRTEQEQLKGAHRAGRVGRAEGTGPA